MRGESFLYSYLFTDALRILRTIYGPSDRDFFRHRIPLFLLCLLAFELVRRPTRCLNDRAL